MDGGAGQKKKDSTLVPTEIAEMPRSDYCCLSCTHIEVRHSPPGYLTEHEPEVRHVLRSSGVNAGTARRALTLS